LGMRINSYKSKYMLSFPSSGLGRIQVKNFVFAWSLEQYLLHLRSVKITKNLFPLTKAGAGLNYISFYFAFKPQSEMYNIRFKSYSEQI